MTGPATAADSVPYDDPNAVGTIGLCTKDKEPVTSGSLYDQPFAWTAVSSVEAPAGYEKGKAVLIAFQPRVGVDPGEWSGSQLTASSSFTNPGHPMAQATYADEPLVSFVGAYPPDWDGLIQLRMYFGATDSPAYQTRYPATTIRVTGDRWSVVAGGTAPCDAGSATSIETTTLPKSALKKPPPVKVNGEVPGSSKTRSSKNGDASVENGAGDTSAQVSNDAGAGSGLVGAGLAGVAIVGVGGAVVYVVRRTFYPSG